MGLKFRVHMFTLKGAVSCLLACLFIIIIFFGKINSAGASDILQLFLIKPSRSVLVGYKNMYHVANLPQQAWLGTLYKCAFLQYKC